jgi:hypothetical protein
MRALGYVLSLPTSGNKSSVLDLIFACLYHVHATHVHDNHHLHYYRIVNFKNATTKFITTLQVVGPTSKADGGIQRIFARR